MTSPENAAPDPSNRCTASAIPLTVVLAVRLFSAITPIRLSLDVCDCGSNLAGNPPVVSV